MSARSHDEIVSWHRELLQEAATAADWDEQRQQDFARRVHELITNVLESSRTISFSHQRDELRSTLLLWASYLTDHGEDWPDIDIDTDKRRPPEIEDRDEYVSIVDVIPHRHDEDGQKKGSLVTLSEGYVAGPQYARLMRGVAARLEGKLNASEVPMNPRFIRWDLMKAYIERKVLDLCKDPFFINDVRNQNLDVVDFGRLGCFTALASEKLPAMSSALTDPSKETKKRLAAFIDHVNSESGNPEIGILGDTAASMEVLGAFSQSPTYGKAVNCLSSEAHLFVWLLEKPMERMAICDVGVARRIRGLTEKQIEDSCLEVPSGRYSHALVSFEPHTDFPKHSRLRFIYSPRLHVGLVHSRRDGRWRRLLSSAFAEELVASSLSAPWDATLLPPGERSGSTVSSELLEVGIEALPLPQLCESLGCRYADLLDKAIVEAQEGGKGMLRSYLCSLKEGLLTQMESQETTRRRT